MGFGGSGIRAWEGVLGIRAKDPLSETREAQFSALLLSKFLLFFTLAL